MYLEWESFYIGTICITLITCLLHMVGIILLFRMRNEFFNQITIMINLALTETMFCLNLCIEFLCKIIMNREDWVTLIYLKTFLLTLDMLTFTVNKFVVLYLIIDRFLDIKLHMRYFLYFKQSTVTNTLILMWITGTLYAFIQGALFNRKITGENKAWSTHGFVCMTLDIIITLTTLPTYGYFFYKTRTMVKNDNSQREPGRRKSLNKHLFKFAVPFLILATYLIFNVTSSFLSVSFTYHKKIILLQMAWITRVLGFLTDALLYIFLQKSVRAFIKSKCRWRRQRNEVSASETSVGS